MWGFVSYTLKHSFRKVSLPLTVAAGVACATAANATSVNLTLDGFTSSIQSVDVSGSSVDVAANVVGSSGFNITDTSGNLGSFVGWCLDVSHYLMGVNQSQQYTIVSDPFSNSFGLSAVAQDRVQRVFDANYATLDFSIGDHAAALARKDAASASLPLLRP